MVKSDDDEDKEVIILEIKQNLNDCSLQKLKRLENTLIDLFSELTIGKYFLNESLDNLKNKENALTIQIFELGE